MWKFLQSIFGKNAPEKRPTTATVPLNELETWLKQARAPMHARFVEYLAATRSRIDNLAATVREKVQALQSAQLMNPEIPDRAKDFMQGNREEYCRRVTQYLDALTIPNAAEELSQFFTQHKQNAETFTKGILRPFQILQEFFAHESKEITTLLADIEKEILVLRSQQEELKMKELAIINEEIQTLVVRQQQLQGLEHEQTELKKQHTESERTLRALAAEEERLLKDTERQHLLQKASEAKKNLRTHEQKMCDIFKKFEPALRKFYRMATRHVKLIESYIQDPVIALVEDLHLDILEVIVDINRLLSFNRFDLGEKSARVLDALDVLKKEYIGGWLREYGQLAKAEKDTQLAFEQCSASKNLARIQHLHEETRRQLQIVEQRKAIVQKDLGKFNLDEIKAQLEARIKDITQATVMITL